MQGRRPDASPLSDGCNVHACVGFQKQDGAAIVTCTLWIVSAPVKHTMFAAIEHTQN